MSREIRTLSIKTRAGFVRARFEIVDPGRVLILLKNEQEEPPFSVGSVMIRNRAQEHGTSNGTAWMAYEHGLFSAWRAGEHIRRHGGASNGTRDSAELLELFRNIRDVRAFVKERLYMDMLPVRVETMHYQAISVILRLLKTKKGAEKLAALANFERAMEPTDSLGRHNPPAAAMAGGAGIGHLLNRQADVRYILERINLRSLLMHRELKRIERCYRELLRLLGGRSGKSRSRETIPVLLKSKKTSDWRRAKRILEEQMEAFRGIRSKPFLKNRHQLGRDLARVRDGLLAEGIRQTGSISRATNRQSHDMRLQELNEIRASLERRFAVMRQGITWMLAKFHLEMRIIAPLSWLMADVRADHSVILRANDLPTRGELDISVILRANEASTRKEHDVDSSMKPLQFQEMRLRIGRFALRAAERDDDLLRTPVKKNVLTHVAEASVCMKQEDWDEVKKQLVEASSFL